MMRRIFSKKGILVLSFSFLFKCILYSTWNIETVPDTDKIYGLFTSITVDTNNYPQISYYSGCCCGEYSSIDTDSSNNPHISYYDWTFGTLKYYNGATGNIVTVDSTYGTGRYSSLKLDSNNRPHIAYYDSIYGDLRYAFFNGSIWTYEIVDSSGDVGRFASIALDPSTQLPRIAYYDWTNGRLKCAIKTGSGWIFQYPDFNILDDVGEYCSLAISPSGVMGISYFDGSNGYLKFALYNNETWISTVVDSGTINAPFTGYYTSCAIDSTGKIHISYYSYSLGKLRYANGSISTGWTFSTPDNTMDDVGGYTSITLDSNNRPIISYYNWTNSSLKVARWTGSNWNIQTIDNNNDVGEYTSISIDSNQNIYVSYLDMTNFDLKMARFNGSSWSTQTVDGNPSDLKLARKQGPSWTIQSIDTLGDVGSYSSIDIDKQNNIHIGYFDFTNIDAKYAFGFSAWTPSSVQSGGNIGYYASIAVDTAGVVHMCYYDSTNKDLIYAKKNTSIWSYQIVDSYGDVGLYCSIAIDKNNNPRISYYDWTNGNLKHAYLASSTWLYSIVDSSGDVGLYTSIAVDNNNCSHISYYDWDNSCLKYAKWNGNSWEKMIVDNSGDVGWDTSIQVDKNCYPRIAYFDWTNDDLKYAWWNGSSWQISTVDATGEVGQYCSLHCNNYGDPKISYFDATNKKLKYASWTSEFFYIKGYIREGTTGISSVTVTLSGDANSTYTTGTSGYYEFTNLTGNRTYIITPSRTGYSFNPLSKTFYSLSTNYDNENFNGTQVSQIYTISGYVRDSGNNPVENVKITLTGSNSAEFITKTDGYYEFKGLATGNYTVTPSKPGITFIPENRTYSNLFSNQVNQDFTATQVTNYIISGYIKDVRNNPISGVNVYLNGNISSVYLTGSDGYFVFYEIPYGNYTLIPEKSGYYFTPSSRNYSPLSSNQTGQNFTGELSGGEILNISVQTLNFGNVDIGDSKTMNFTISNSGTGLLTGTISSNKNWIIVNPKDFRGNNVVVNVTVDNSILNVKQGTYSGNVTVTSNGGNKTIEIRLNATCIIAIPNPFYPKKSKLTFMGSGLVPYKTNIKIFTITGELVNILENCSKFEWDGKNLKNEPLSDGIYIYTYKSPLEKGSGKFTLINNHTFK